MVNSRNVMFSGLSLAGAAEDYERCPKIFTGRLDRIRDLGAELSINNPEERGLRIRTANTKKRSKLTCTSERDSVVAISA